MRPRYQYIFIRGRGLVTGHRLAWEQAHGPIPPGFHVHHIDHNGLNNDLSNLRLMSAHDHISEHAKERNKDPKFQATLQAARRAARERQPFHERICIICGTQFMAQGSLGKQPATMCSQTCRHKRWAELNPERRRELDLRKKLARQERALGRRRI